MFGRTLVILGVLVTLGASCAGDETRRLSQRGESCDRKSDCSSGLACVSGVCAEGSFNVEPTTSECVAIECRVNDDCCAPSALCTLYREECDAGFTESCEAAATYCACESTCEAGQCTQPCDEDFDCLGGRFCERGECVECQCDSHCGPGRLCRDARCVTECTRDAQCAAFQRCQDARCVDVGCETDRECVAYLGSVLAFCDAGACRERCSSDIECGNAENFSFRACVEGTCRDVGCASDEECRAYFQRRGDGFGRDAVCRPRAAAQPSGGVPGVGGEDCPDTAVCGNGLIETGEDCDGSNFGGQTCATYLGNVNATGSLFCDPLTCVIDASGCSTTAGFCGDLIINGFEECDGTNLGFADCWDATGGSMPYGMLACSPTCVFDTSGCSATPTTSFCGDGIAEGTEECDTADLRGETCNTATFGALPNGTLGCYGDCTLDVSNCVAAAPFCGDGMVNGTEECDSSAGSPFAGETCSTVTAGVFPLGALECDLCTIDESACVRSCDTCLTANDGVCDEGLEGTCADGTDCSDCCTDDCAWANDGVCDEPSLCAPGTDCTDCGG
jgi:hypothetical protein